MKYPLAIGVLWMVVAALVVTLFGAGAPAAPGEAGALRADPDGILDLPGGFHYRIISRKGDKMDDGLVVPARPDGMGALEGPGGLTILIRNHELQPHGAGAFGIHGEGLDRVDRSKFYDPGTGKRPIPGGTTTIVFDTKTQTVKSQFLSLAGTVRNCAGGVTPWNTWITCEETAQKKGTGWVRRFRAKKNHGYNFEVPATTAPGLVEAVPLRAMGRFVHEAAAVDPATGIVYQTEDREDGLIYRFIPKVRGRLRDGGRLQALAIFDRSTRDARNWGRNVIPQGKPLAVQWIDLDDVDARKDDLRKRGYKAGAARFARGEGMCYQNGAIFFTCTNGGRRKLGQIWRYTPSPAEGRPAERENPGRLTLFFEPNDPRVLVGGDNITATPWGDLFVCEDREGDRIRIIRITPEGKSSVFARNHKHSEFAGAVFSPDGTTLFVNLQVAGLTFAITGPWERYASAVKKTR